MKGVDTSGTEQVGRYRLGRVLGEGGMGVVHLASDDEGRRVAIKVLRPQVAADKTAIRRLAREVDSMRRVRSPNVAEILDADITAERPYIVTRYVPGRTLEEAVLDQGPVQGRRLQRIAVGLAQALAAIHGAGIVHRDLKPGNVMLLDNEPVLIDFGIAQTMDATRLTATGMVIGTPGYLAPEIIEGLEAGPASDVHSWAGTLAYAATGRPPFGTGTFESIFYKIMQGTPDLGGVPEPMLPLIRAAMARHPAERPTAVTLVQFARRIDLDATMTDQTLVDRPAPAASPMPATGQRMFTPHPDEPSTKVDDPRTTTSPLPPVPAADETRVEPPADQTRIDPPRSRTAPQPVQQPRDFVGMLPPVPPPPAPPKPEPRPRRSTGRPYVPPPPSERGQRQAYAGQAPPGYEPYTRPQQQPRQPQQYAPPPQGPPQGAPPRQQARPDGRGTVADGTRRDGPKPERRKPYGLYRLCGLAALAIVLGLAAVVPVLTLVFALAGAAVLRAGDSAAKHMESKRVRRGPGGGDVFAAVLKTPFGVPGAALKTAMWGGAGLFAGAVLVGFLVVANPSMTIGRGISYGVMAVIALHFLGPGSAPPRRQMARIWGALLPRPEPAIVVTLVLALAAGLTFAYGQGSTPDLRPVGFNQDTQTLTDLKDGILRQVGLG